MIDRSGSSPRVSSLTDFVSDEVVVTLAVYFLHQRGNLRVAPTLANLPVQLLLDVVVHQLRESAPEHGVELDLGALREELLGLEPAPGLVLLVAHHHRRLLLVGDLRGHDDVDVRGAVPARLLLAELPQHRLRAHERPPRGVDLELGLALAVARGRLLDGIARLHAAAEEPPIRLRLHLALAEHRVALRVRQEYVRAALDEDVQGAAVLHVVQESAVARVRARHVVGQAQERVVRVIRGRHGVRRPCVARRRSAMGVEHFFRDVWCRSADLRPTAPESTVRFYFQNHDQS
mmetsp:Transcript_3083/g.14450  ORF Transcript_3083/g.14450 Transcript_3083/m.14450 type:complete len:290 (-) Transcript_3083:1861-2730(-)